MIFKILIFSLILLFNSHLSEAVFVFNNSSYNDNEALQEGQNIYSKSVVLILTERGNGSGVLIDLSNRPDLKGKIILTAAHVIEEKITDIFMDGLKPHHDEEDPLDESLKIPFKSVKKHPLFVYGKEEARIYDYGLIILNNPISNIQSLNLSEIPLTLPQPLIVSGFGQKLILTNEATATGATNDLKRRTFKSLITESNNDKSILYSDIKNEMAYSRFAFPYVGDSGGSAIFTEGSSSQFIGIVSGKHEQKVAFVRPSIQELYKILQD